MKSDFCNALRVSILKILLSSFAVAATLDVDAKAVGCASNVKSDISGLKHDRPVKVLYLGDSLTDYDRGSNHLDKVQAKLEKIVPGKVTFYNYAVRGDFITRVLDRFNNVEKVYGAKRFDGIWDRQYDWAFVILGHNDTRASSETDFAKPHVEVERIASSYDKLVSLLRSKGIGRIIIVSPSCGNFELTKAKTEKRLAAIKAGKGGKKKHAVRFCDPKHLEKFRDVVKKFAAENCCEFFDVYDGMKSLPDKAELFSAKDGVHLTQKGHEYIAEKTFDYLSGSGCR
jgi:lysophospholipase L1-like esterase